MPLLPELRSTNNAKIGLLASTAAAPIRETANKVNSNGHHNGRRRRRPQIRYGIRQSVLQADTALVLVRQHGFSIVDAARRTGSNPTAIEAMAILHDNSDPELLAAVRTGEVPFLPTAARIKPLVRAMKAFNALSNLDRIEWARREDPEKLFNEVIVPASAPAPVDLVVET
jgi:hypothetical protein